MPWLYFAAAEGGIALLWLCGGALALWRIMRSPRGAARRRGLLWLLGLTTIYALLVSFSNGLQWFVVYGRVARGMAPFMVLLCAFGFAPLLSSARRQTAFAAAVCLLAGFNFAPIIGQQHYRVIQRQVYDNYEYEDVSFESTYGANAVCFGVCQRQWPDARYQIAQCWRVLSHCRNSRAPAWQSAEGDSTLQLGKGMAIRKYDGINAAIVQYAGSQNLADRHRVRRAISRRQTP